MTLYEMLDSTYYFQQVHIYETNNYGENMPVFKGEVSGARVDSDRTWDYLMCEVDGYYIVNNILIVKVVNEYKNEQMSTHYLFSEKWTKDKRPWLTNLEVEKLAEEE